MEKTLVFRTADEVRLRKILRFMIPTYLTSLFNTVYTMVDGIFVSAYVGTDALAAINIVYPLVNVLTGIALAFATGGSALAALHLGAGEREQAGRTFSVSLFGAIGLGCLAAVLALCGLPILLTLLGATPLTMDNCRIYAFWWLVGTPAVIGKELFTYFIRVDGSPTYSFLTALAGGVLNIVLDYVFIGCWDMGILGAALATILGLCLSFAMGIAYFAGQKRLLRLTLHGLSGREGVRCMVNGTSEFINQIAIAITTIVFNRTAMQFAGEDGIAAVSIIMYLQFLCIGVYFGFSMGLAPPLSYAYGDRRLDVCRKLEGYAYRFLVAAPPLLYAAVYLLAPVGVSFFAEPDSAVYEMAVWGMRLYGLGFLFSGVNIFSAIRMMAYGKGHISGFITFLRSFALLLLFLIVLPRLCQMNGVWLAVPAAEFLTLAVAVFVLLFLPETLRTYRRDTRTGHKT